MIWLVFALLALASVEARAIVPSDAAALHLVYTSEVRGTVGICG